MNRSVRLLLLTLLISSLTLPVFVEAAPQFHFAISEALLNQLAADNSISRTTRIKMNARSGLVMSGKKGGGKVGRSSVTGKFVTVKYAKSHPKTTEVEKIKQLPKK